MWWLVLSITVDVDVIEEEEIVDFNQTTQLK